MGVCREMDNRDEGWRDTGSRSKKKGVIRVRGECVCGCKLYGEPVREGWEMINRMQKGRV